MNPYAMQIVSLAIEVEAVRGKAHLGDTPHDPDFERGVRDVINLLHQANDLLTQTETGDPTDMPKEVKEFMKMMIDQMKKGEM